MTENLELNEKVVNDLQVKLDAALKLIGDTGKEVANRGTEGNASNNSDNGISGIEGSDKESPILMGIRKSKSIHITEDVF